MEYTTVISNKGKTLIELEGYLYRKTKTSKNMDVTYWTCLNYDQNRCKVALIFKDGKIVSQKGEHCHSSSPTKLQAKKLLFEIKGKARSTTEAPSVLISTQIQGQPIHVLAKLPKEVNIKQTIQRERKLGKTTHRFVFVTFIFVNSYLTFESSFMSLWISSLKLSFI